MSNRYKYLSILVLLLFYSSLFYFIVNHYQRIDFSSFFLSSHALLQGENPYQNFLTTYLPTQKILPANLNPPFVLWSFMFLSKLNYSHALLVWFFFCLLLGIIGIAISLRFAFSKRFLQQNSAYLYLLYFASFATLTNLITQQFGSILLFFMMLGYYFYLHQRDFLAGFLWGIIISIKLFPALLLFFVLKQNRKKVLASILITLFITMVLPLFIYGPWVYDQYFKMMSGVFWYGDDWNGSLYGFIFRFFFGGQVIPKMSSLIVIEVLYIVFFLIFLFWYWRNLGPKEEDPVNHQPFCLTLAMMLFLSPFGWVYYFSLLFFPMSLVWYSIAKDKSNSVNTMLLWLMCFFLINFPVDYVISQHMSNFIVRISFFSSFFYGLILLIYLLGSRKKIYGGIDLVGIKNFSMPPIFIIILFGLLVPIICYISRLLELDLFRKTLNHFF
ncbi:Protein of uncharacterised function (DUF2029) [Legionella wadsworthii]|uniref:Protein of uncharacterized function (DUF2029) n=1 Tax=Legionella wadsworthii TaxID=28088 RepID=A0A378LWK5_9GAMM|nr:glycosyltransferase family 87 protein [Legionella wadsworthii]STY30546.1 Protein of uncharacterised function (DUF2029) [Legionella wadsworthii]